MRRRAEIVELHDAAVLERRVRLCFAKKPLAPIALLGP